MRIEYKDNRHIQPRNFSFLASFVSTSTLLIGSSQPQNVPCHVQQIIIQGEQRLQKCDL